jgi:hypothetical protein
MPDRDPEGSLLVWHQGKRRIIVELLLCLLVRHSVRPLASWRSFYCFHMQGSADLGEGEKAWVAKNMNPSTSRLAQWGY